MIKAEIVADSINQQGDRITTYLLIFPRFILAELNTHRVFSKNSASSRAIPFEKMIKMVQNDPFIPIAWQKYHSGMQGNEYITDESELSKIRTEWLRARDVAVEYATYLNDRDVTKQLCNRLLEPFMWHTVLLTGTEFENFFELRCPIYRAFGNVFKSRKDCIEKYPANINLTDLDWLEATESQAEIHMQALAEAMWDAYNESTPKTLQSGEWHIPFLDNSYYKDDRSPLLPFLYKTNAKPDTLLNYSIKIATARAARLSYMTFDGEIDYEKDIQLHDRLLADNHMSPFEHCCRSMTEEEYHSFFKGELCVVETSDDWYQERFMKGDKGCGWCNNFKGFIQYRYMIDNKYDI